MHKDKAYYKSQAKKQLAKEFANFNPAQFADEIIEWAKARIASGEDYVIEDFGKGAETGTWREYMAQNIDGTHIAALDHVNSYLSDARGVLDKAHKAGIEGSYDACERVWQYEMSLVPDEDEN